MPSSAYDLFSDEEVDLKKEIGKIVKDPDRWMKTPHDLLGGQKPLDLIGTDKEQQLRDLIRSIKHGMVL